MPVNSSTSIKKIKRESTSERVFTQLKNLIDTGSWPPGYRIPSEYQLAEEFGVSRMTIRSATQKLQNFGLLDVQVGNGSFVRNVTIDSYIFGPGSKDIVPNALSDAFSLRYYLEKAAVDFAIKNATDEELKEFHTILKRLIKASKANDDSFRDLDIDFHRYIYIMSHNGLLLTIFNMTEPLLRAQIDKFDNSIEDIEELQSGRQDFHTRLYQCIANRNIEESLKILDWYQKAEQLISE